MNDRKRDLSHQDQETGAGGWELGAAVSVEELVPALCVPERTVRVSYEQGAL